MVIRSEQGMPASQAREQIDDGARDLLSNSNQFNQINSNQFNQIKFKSIQINSIKFKSIKSIQSSNPAIARIEDDDDEDGSRMMTMMMTRMMMTMRMDRG